MINLKFAVGLTTYFQSVGFNTKNWRKSYDGKKALCHLELAELLCHEDNIEVYNFDSPEFKELLASEEWAGAVAVDESELPETPAEQNEEEV